MIAIVWVTKAMFCIGLWKEVPTMAPRPRVGIDLAYRIGNIATLKIHQKSTRVAFSCVLGVFEPCFAGGAAFLLSNGPSFPKQTAYTRMLQEIVLRDGILCRPRENPRASKRTSRRFSCGNSSNNPLALPRGNFPLRAREKQRGV